MAGGQSYYDHQPDFRNGSAESGMVCMGSRVGNNYSTLLYQAEAQRIVAQHAALKAAPITSCTPA